MGLQQQVYYEAHFDAARERWAGTATGAGVTVPIELERGAWPPARCWTGPARVLGFAAGDQGRPDPPDRPVQDRPARHPCWLDSPDRNLLNRPAVSIFAPGSRRHCSDADHTASRAASATTAKAIEGGSSGARHLAAHPRSGAAGRAPPLPQRAAAIELPPEPCKFAGRYTVEGGQVVTTITARMAGCGSRRTGGEGRRSGRRTPGDRPSRSRTCCLIADDVLLSDLRRDGRIRARRPRRRHRVMQRYLGRETAPNGSASGPIERGSQPPLTTPCRKFNPASGLPGWADGRPCGP